MYPFFKITINDSDDVTGIDFNALVDYPAHMKPFISFSKDATKMLYSVNKEERKVTGVLISADTPIFRNEPKPHYVIFDLETIEKINVKWVKNGFTQNLNSQHDMSKIIDGAILTNLFIVNNSNDNYPNVPKAFENQNIKDGSLIGTYYVENDKLWEDIKSGKWGGFSVEGFFDLLPTKVKVKQNKIKMKKKEKSIFSLLFGSKQKFAEATTADGVVVMYDGEISEGSALTVEVDGANIPAPEGAHELTLEDGSIKLVTLDGSGIVLSVEDFKADEDEDDEVEEELRSEVAETLRKILADTNERFNKLETELNLLKKGDSFGSNPKGGALKSDTKKLTVSEILKLK